MKKEFTYTDAGELKSIPTTEILEFRSDGNYLFVVFISNRKDLLLCIQLGKVDEHLTKGHNFIRIHNCRLPNWDFAKKATRGRRPLMLMDYKLPIPIGKTYISKTRKRLRKRKK